jgi:TPR repeat protein
MDAANSGMPQAEYIFGILHSDNLIVKRDWNKAYYWVKKAADGGFDEAKKILPELEEKVPLASTDSLSVFANTDSLKSNSDLKNNSLTSSIGLVYIDFDLIADSVRTVSDKDLLTDLLNTGNDKLADTLGIKSNKDSVAVYDSLRLEELNRFADAGSPEALTLLGRYYETGFIYKKNLITAAMFYIRAVRMDSPRAPFFLWEMLKRENFYSLLQQQAKDENTDAMFAWYGLNILGLDNQITTQDAMNLLIKAASMNHIPSLVELGLNYYTGRNVVQNYDEAVKIWQQAFTLGSTEAEVRIETAKIFGYLQTENISTAVQKLKTSAEYGSVLAQVTLAYCSENGLGMRRSLADAVKYYRFAAQRGSRYAYRELKRLYDSLRPADNQFVTEE